MRKYNQLLETDKILNLNKVIVKSMMVAVSHTRRKTLFPKHWCKHEETITGETVQLGGSFKLTKLIDCMKKRLKS
jgi:hypothetical protein